MRRTCCLLLCACLVLLASTPVRAVELVFWTTEIHQDRLVVIEFLAKTFGVLQDDVTVKVVSVNENEVLDRLNGDLPDSERPHLVSTGSELLVAMARTGGLDTKVPSRFIREIGVDRFYRGALRQLELPGGGQWYGVPFHGWIQGIWYRADWFASAGLKPPATWDAILAAAERFTDPVKGRYGILVGTGEDHFTTQVFTQIAMSNSAAMFSPGGKVVFDSPETVEALKFYARLAKFGPPGPQTWRARDYFMQGRLAMLFYSTFIMDDLALEQVAADSLTAEHFPDLDGAEFDPTLVENIGMIPFVSRSSKAGYGMINGFGICQRLTPEEQAAVLKFLAFLFSPEPYVDWLHMAPGGMLPVLRDVADSDRFMADPPGLFRRYGRETIRRIINGLADVKSFGLVEGRRQAAASLVYAQGVIPRMVQRTVFGNVPAEESVRLATEEIRAIARDQHR